MDAGESETSSSTDGTFTIKYGNGVLLSLGGQDIDTQTQLDGLLLLRDLDGYSDDEELIMLVMPVMLNN